MSKRIGLFLLAGLLAISGCSLSPPALSQPAEVVHLPAPVLEGKYSLEECIKQRRSIRSFSEKALSLLQVSQLLWATQGRTDGSGGRSAPSAGALYPLEVYLVAARVENLDAGVYRYSPSEHSLVLVREENRMNELASAALNQSAVKNAAVSLVIGAIYERTTKKYGERGTRYAVLEAGHAAQNFCLQAVALDLGAVTIGAFEDERVKTTIGMGNSESPLYILPVGHPE